MFLPLFFNFLTLANVLLQDASTMERQTRPLTASTLKRKTGYGQEKKEVKSLRLGVAALNLDQTEESPSTGTTSLPA